MGYGGGTWEPLEVHGHRASPARRLQDDLRLPGEQRRLGAPLHATPSIRRLWPGGDDRRHANPDSQTIQNASYGATRLGLAAGCFVFLDPGGVNEEYVRVISVDPENQALDAIVTKDHAAGERIRPTI